MSYEPPICTGCGGQGGAPETTLKPDGGQVTVFRTCGTCHGRGRA
jgi:DnaJ-class molecular chaperone